MKHFTWLCLLLLSKFTIGQTVLIKCNDLIASEQFSHLSDNWDYRNNDKEAFLILDQKYILQRTADNGFSSSLLKKDLDLNTFELSSEIMLAKDKKNKKSSAGLLFHAQKDGNNAMILEVNTKGYYRVAIISDGSWSPFYPENGSWLKPTVLIEASNTYMLRAHNNRYDIHLNDVFQTSFVQTNLSGGGCGYYISPRSKMVVDNFKLSTVKEDNGGDDLSSNGGGENVRDLVLVFKKKIDKQQREIKVLRGKLALCETKISTDSLTLVENNELKKDKIILKKRIDLLDAELSELRGKLSYLETMKEEIKDREHGDLIIDLTEIIAQEREAKKKLQEENEKLKKQIEELRTDQ